MNDAHDNAQTDKDVMDKAMRVLVRNVKDRLRTAIAILTARADEPWSPKIAAAVPEIREALKLLEGR